MLDPTKSAIGQILGKIFTFLIVVFLIWFWFSFGWLVARVATILLRPFGFRNIPYTKWEIFRTGWIGFCLFFGVYALFVPRSEGLLAALILIPISLFVLWCVGRSHAEKDGEVFVSSSSGPCPSPSDDGDARADKALEALERAHLWAKMDNDQKYAITGDPKYLKK